MVSSTHILMIQATFGGIWFLMNFDVSSIRSYPQLQARHLFRFVLRPPAPTAHSPHIIKGAVSEASSSVRRIVMAVFCSSEWSSWTWALLKEMSKCYSFAQSGGAVTKHFLFRPNLHEGFFPDRDMTWKVTANKGEQPSINGTISTENFHRRVDQ